MNFRQVKNISKIVLILALIGYLATAVMLNQGMSMAEPTVYVSTVLMLIAVVIRFVWGKCPHCNRRITRQHFSDKICPYCGKDMMEG